MAQVSASAAASAAASSFVFDIASVDDFYFSALFDEAQTDIFPISDSRYAQELQLQEALYSSSITPKMTNPNPSFPSSSSSSFLVSSLSPPSITVLQILEPITAEAETGESSHIYCEICTERKPTDEIFRSGSNYNESVCAHSFCSDCIAKHVATKVEESPSAVVACPGPDCKGVHGLEIEACRAILPREVAERWEEALCEALIGDSEKFYCPFRDCSAVLVREADEEEVRESECPMCHRLFCARCIVPWHSGIGCEEYERLNEDERGSEDLMVMEMAKEKKWKRCPRCKFYVERIDGCLHIACRCNFEFCYGCGSQWTHTHGGCQRD
ncbi:E3 ubiquitin ligase RBR family [Parasponia andersonii]|uniref:RBR-type E3 ubiquitin transferase n=1 Tax=Parasponia andersonii TaxID=3476 RepID=A0A2P5A6L7_PARAD|nr:E3 ubiquitin ligase RBR family [Parasponia andersonii]